MAQPPKPTILTEPYLFSVAKATSNSARAHEQRRKYVDSVLPLIGPQRSIDFWGKDSFFGRINVYQKMGLKTFIIFWDETIERYRTRQKS